jgi:4-hydroxythreonine-4-phosphate dehydrogenase
VRPIPRVIGITLGDAAGIGPEIIDAALDSGRLDRGFAYRRIGSRSDAKPGEPTPATARAAWGALEEAAVLAEHGEIAAVVTGPIHKARMQAEGFAFPGQTEFFAERSGAPDYAMCLTGGALTVALVTAHLPLRSVPEALSSEEIVRVGRLLAAFLHEKCSGRPNGEVQHPEARALRIAVAGLNPHAGESGVLGREEIEIIAPAVTALEAGLPSGAHFVGPFSPDTVFHRAVNGEFDGVLCMYHDQGLIPLKLHAFDEGVNVTLGLPYPRTSPDHGTAFEIAGRGVARCESMVAAINLAARMAGARSITA